MQSNKVLITAKPGRRICFLSGEKVILLKQEPDESPPSSSLASQREDRPDIRPRILNRDLPPPPAFNSRLIEMVKNRRCLYDGTTPGGRSSAFRLQIWDGLARQLEYAQGGFSLQKRWKQIRDKYVKERRRLAEREHLDLASNWPLFHKLSFLDPFIVERDPDRSISPAQQYYENSYTRPRGVLSPAQIEEFNRRLINAVREHPSLYARSDPHYHSQKRRTEAWLEVLTDLNFPCDMSELQRYWKGIRDRYIRIRRSLRDPSSSDGNSSSSSGMRPPPPKWVHYDDLTWIEPFLDYQQRIKEEFALSRQAAERARRGLVAPVDEEDGVVVDYEVDREDVQSSLLYDAHAELLESGVRFDGDTAYAASVISDIRALPLEVQAQVRARIELALEAAPSAMLQRMEANEEGMRERRRRGGGGVKEERREEHGLIVSREEIVGDTV